MQRLGGISSPVGTVAVVGGGASGILAATHLLARAERAIDVVIIEPRAQIGAGVAYCTDDPTHLLNAPSSEMSAWSDRPSDFTSYISTRGYPADGFAFAARHVFRDYLAASFAEAQAQQRSDSGSERVAGEAVALIRHEGDRGSSFIVGMRDGSHLAADHVVLAIGPANPTAKWRELAGQLHSQKVIADPWVPGALDVLHRDDRVLLVGSGLTMVDIALSLQDRNHRGTLVARSRHGLLPLRQVVGPSETVDLSLDISGRSAREVLRAIRDATDKAIYAGQDWRGVIGAVRERLPLLWQGLAELEQQRFLRHAGRYWEIHRHRMAPVVGQSLDRLLDSGQLTVGSGRLTALESRAQGVAASLLRAGGREEMLVVDAVVNCTGAGHAVDYRTSSRLIGRLLESGTAAIDRSGLGLLVDAHGDLCDAGGHADPRLHSLGWLRRGQLYESTAIAEIRVQAETLASRIAGR
jgi:uncharacterized NAD(P)/FAD-binding protein YdhS